MAIIYLFLSMYIETWWAFCRNFFAGKNSKFFTMWLYHTKLLKSNWTIIANYGTFFFVTKSSKIWLNGAYKHLEIFKSKKNDAKNLQKCPKLLKISFTDFCWQLWHICSWTWWFKVPFHTEIGFKRLDGLLYKFRIDYALHEYSWTRK